MKNRWFLAPLSALYGFIIHVRHILYDEHILPSYSFKIPTICVGNLAVGGTGKTPHTEYLIRMLSSSYKVAVLSRGYRRKTHGFILADNQSTAATIGDESMQIHRKFPDIPVAVCENRIQGIKHLKRSIPDLEVVILDDALQHRPIRCGFNILLTAANNLYVDDHLFPWGELRDLKYRSLVAQSIIVTNCPPNMKPIEKRVIDNRLHLPAFQKLYFSKVVYEPIPCQGENPLVISGIAQPEAFLNHIKSIYPNAENLVFGDHHRFTSLDVKRILTAAQKHDCVLTTEKDYERLLLTDIVKQLGNKLHVVPIRVDLGEFTEALQRQLTTYLDERIRYRTVSKKQKA